MNHSEFFKQKASCFPDAGFCHLSSGSSSYQALALAGITVVGQKTSGMEPELSNATHQRLVEGSEQTLAGKPFRELKCHFPLSLWSPIRPAPQGSRHRALLTPATFCFTMYTSADVQIHISATKPVMGNSRY